MKLRYVEIENYRAIKGLRLHLDPNLTVFHGVNASGKTSVLSAIAVGLGAIPSLLPNIPGIRFLGSDQRRGEPSPRIMLETTSGISWERRGPARHRDSNRRSVQGSNEVRDLRMALADLVNPRQSHRPIDLPIFVYYDTDRTAFDQPLHRKESIDDSNRYAALEGALSPRPSFRDVLDWFYGKENEELRAQREQSDFSFHLRDLDAVRNAIMSMVPGISNPRIEVKRHRLIVSLKLGSGKESTLVFEQLSGGYRVMLAIAADIAKRMAQGNPHISNPLKSEAIVLIDEIELHLHPSWQQRVLVDLLRTFPNAQFVVATHSPHILTTVKPKNIVELKRRREEIVPLPATAATFGAQAGEVLETVMGVDERPKDNQFVRALNQYVNLVSLGQGESQEAASLRRKLERLSQGDPVLDRIDVEIRRRRLLKNMGRKK